ncbi:MFS transporter [Sphingomonas sp. Y38-1Y]|uniref:MFS transporter n=1 Tax=Sphingomonas sp. Y38-1Y TaxID=3078265 RepID=UPI0028E33A33|nr:MFS transporter [Sphingomonas sp. Y38-1Y]
MFAAIPTLLVLALATVLGFTVMGSFATVQEAAKAELGLSDYALSLISGVSAAVPLLLLSIPIGLAVDRFNRVRILIGLAIVWTIGTALTSVGSSLPVLFAARMLTAIGMTGALTAAVSIAADLCEPQERGRATLILNLGKIVGQALGFALVGALFGWFMAPATSGWFGSMSGWRATHLALALISAVSILPLLLLREPARRESETGPRANFGTLMRELLARRAFLAPLFVGQMSVVMADAAAGIWAAPVLTRSFGLQPADFAGWMGLLLLGAGLIGSIAGGLSADMGAKSLRRGGLLLGAVLAAAVGIPAALFPIAGSVPVFAIALGLLTVSGAVTGLVMAVALTVWLPNELRGLTIGAFLTFAGLFGFGFAPPLVALASDMMGGEHHLPTALAEVAVITSAIGFGGFLLAMRNAPTSSRQPI